MRSRSSCRPRRTQRPGFSIIEVMVAIILIGISLSTLGILAAGAARRNQSVGIGAYRAAVMAELVDRSSSLDYDFATQSVNNLDSTVTTGPLPHRRQVIIATPSGGLTNERTITIIVTPTNTSFRPETTVVRRYQYRAVNPLNLP